MNPERFILDEALVAGTKHLQALGYTSFGVTCAEVKTQFTESTWMPALSATINGHSGVLMFFSEQATNEDSGVAHYVIAECDEIGEVVDLTEWVINDTRKTVKEMFLHWDIVRA